MSEQKPELLAPAGNYEAFLAAVAAGANAVYLAGKRYGARASATNFTDEELEKAVRYAHLHNVRIYVTLNTLLSDSELHGAYLYAHTLYNLGVDALIMQDWGLISLVKQALPDFPVYASTQMTIHNAAGCRGMEEWGASRVILAREVSLDDIKKISADSNVALETFVHGALCLCYSGQCLFSSFVGGRSGNRGRCAQPCRMIYQLQEDQKLIGEEAHLLSPKDLRALELLDDLEAAGISSFKIEGRMKRPEYVATVVSAYADAENADEYTKHAVEQAFNREFTTGYLERPQGADMMSYNRPNNRGVRLGRVERIINSSTAIISLLAPLNLGDGLEIWVKRGGRQGFTVQQMSIDGVPVESAQAGDRVTVNYAGWAQAGDRVFKTSDVELNANAQSMMAPQTLPVDMCLTARLDEPVILTLVDEQGSQVSITSDFKAPRALKHASDYDSIYAQLNRLGGTYWHLQNLTCDMDDDLMLPASVLNQLRRDAVEQLEELRLRAYQRKTVNKPGKMPLVSGKMKAAAQSRLAVCVDNYECARRAVEVGADMLYIGGDVFRSQKPWNKADIAAACELGVPVYYQLPSIAAESETEHMVSLIEQLRGTKVKGLTVSNIWGWQLARECGWSREICGDLGLNVFNSYAADAWRTRGISRLTLSSELTLEQIEALHGDFRRECLVGGNIQVMHSEHCLLGARVGGRTADHKCSMPCLNGHKYSLRDAKGFIFPLVCDTKCRMHIYNGHQLCLLEDLPRLFGAGVDVLRLDLHHYNDVAVGRIVMAYAKVINDLHNGYIPDYDVHKANIAAFSLGRLTKGHYYRGVD